MNPKVVIALITVVVVGGLGWYFLRDQPAAETELPAHVGVPPLPQSTPATPTPEPATPPAEQAPLVAAPLSLDGSDGQVHAAVSDFAAQLATWLTPEEQVRKWVSLVDQIAEGKLPLKNRPLDYPMTTFMTQRPSDRQKGDKQILDPANYARADLLIKVFTSIPSERLAAYYHAWRPMLDKAYSELGGSGGFDKRLRTAIKRVVKVQPLRTPAELVRPITYYKYADPTLEAASDVEKLMWRLGPENSKRVQDYLRALEPEL
jgi:hypothetical protein